MRAVIYCRYSSDLQREESAEAQIRACSEYAEARGYQVIRTYADKAVSGKGTKTNKRYQFKQMISDSSKNMFDIVLVHKYNRFARNERDHVNYEGILNDNNVTLIATAEDFGQGKESIIVKALMRAMSQYYITELADEVRKGHKENALKAMHNGGYAPFGYDVVDRQFVINEFEAYWVRQMFDCAYKRIGFSGLVMDMADAGIKGKRGKPIKYPSIYEILRNERYTGTYVYATKSDKFDRRAKKNAIRIDNAIPKIIDREIWEEVQIIMNERKQTGKNADHLCKGLVYCSNCGAKMYSHIKDGERTFICSKACGVGVVSMDFIDDAVRHYIKELLSDDKQVEIYLAMDSYSSGEKHRVAEFNSMIKKQMQDKQSKIDGYMQSLSMGITDADIVSDIVANIQRLKGEINSLSTQEPPKDFTKEKVIKWLSAVRENPTQNDVKMLISRIDANKKEARITTTLASPILGGDTPIHCFPTYLFHWNFK